MDASNAASVEALVQQAYRWILGREGDPEGVAHYTKTLRSGDIDEAAMRHAFVFSDEFRAGTVDPRLLVDVGGFSVYVEPNDPELGSYIAKHGGWEPNIRELIRELIPAGGTFVDVGANVGVMAFEAAQLAGKVIAFEPQPINADNLRRGVVANGLENVIVHQLALSDQPGMIRTSMACNAKVNSDGPNAAQAVTGDSLLLYEERIDLIKIDIEGHEPAAITGLSKTIAKHQPMLLIEFNPPCLGDPRPFAEQIFSFARWVRVTEAGQERGDVFSADELLSLNRETTHFDLVVRT